MKNLFKKRETLPVIETNPDADYIAEKRSVLKELRKNNNISTALSVSEMVASGVVAGACFASTVNAVKNESEDFASKVVISTIASGLFGSRVYNAIKTIKAHKASVDTYKSIEEAIDFYEEVSNTENEPEPDSTIEVSVDNNDASHVDSVEEKVDDSYLEDFEIIPKGSIFISPEFLKRKENKESE